MRIRLILCFLAMLAPGGLEAASLTVAPTRVELAEGETSAAVTLHNNDAETVMVQVQTFAWLDGPATADLQPTRALLAVPPIAEIAGRGRQIIPADWIKEATIVHPGQPQPSAGGYGYQVWILAGERRMFVLRGVRGQAIYVDSSSRLVMVHTAMRKRARDPGIREENALWRSLVQQLGH